MITCDIYNIVGVVERSPLWRLPYFDITRHCLNDPMHLISNTVKAIFEWVSGIATFNTHVYKLF